MKFPRLIPVFILFLFSSHLFSQDIISLKTGDKIEAKVIEVGKLMVKYKKHNMPNGQVFLVKMENIASIKFENGKADFINSSVHASTAIEANKQLKLKFGLFRRKYYLSDTKIKKAAFLATLQTNQKAYKEYQTGQTLFTFSALIGYPAGFVLGYNLGRLTDKDPYAEKPKRKTFIYAGIASGASLFLELVGKTKMRNGVQTYNSVEKVGFNFGLNENGLGLAVRF